MGLVGLLVWSVLWVLIDKSPTLRGQTCQGVLGLVFHRFPGTSIRPHYMPVKRAECFPFRDFLNIVQTTPPLVLNNFSKEFFKSA